MIKAGNALEAQLAKFVTQGPKGKCGLPSLNRCFHSCICIYLPCILFLKKDGLRKPQINSYFFSDGNPVLSHFITRQIAAAHAI